MSDPQWVTPTVQCNPVYVFDRLVPLLRRDVDEFNGLTAEERRGYEVKLDQHEDGPEFSVRIRRFEDKKIYKAEDAVPTILVVRSMMDIRVEGDIPYPGKSVRARPEWNPVQRCHVSINNDYHLLIWEFSRHVLLPFFFPHLVDQHSGSPLIVKRLKGA